MNILETVMIFDSKSNQFWFPNAWIYIHKTDMLKIETIFTWFLSLRKANTFTYAWERQTLLKLAGAASNNPLDQSLAKTSRAKFSGLTLGTANDCILVVIKKGIILMGNKNSSFQAYFFSRHKTYSIIGAKFFFIGVNYFQLSLFIFLWHYLLLWGAIYFKVTL